MIVDEIRDALRGLSDGPYRDFQARLIPTVAAERIIGVRTPALRKLAAQLSKRADVGLFLDDLPHPTFDENQLHAFIISRIADFPACLAAVDRFLPYIDNWATCDQLSPKVFKKHRQALAEPIRRWIDSGETYAVRFGVGMMMEHYLGEDYDPAWPALVASIRSEEYYVRMMVAWYFATALAKRWDDALPFLEARRLDPWTHNKAIQKAIESYRIGPEQKAHLRGLKLMKNDRKNDEPERL